MSTVDLTSTPINELPAGRLIDGLVAIEVMGWTRDTFVETEGWNSGVQAYSPWYPAGEKLTLQNMRHAFTPSTDIKQAWEVVERLRALGHYANVNVRREVVWCRIENCDGDELVAVKVDTAPLAICRAALMAVCMPPPPGWSR